MLVNVDENSLPDKAFIDITYVAVAPTRFQAIRVVVCGQFPDIVCKYLLVRQTVKGYFCPFSLENKLNNFLKVSLQYNFL